MNLTEITIENLLKECSGKTKMPDQQLALQRFFDNKCDLEYSLNRSLKTKTIDPYLAAVYILGSLYNDHLSLPKWMQTQAANYFVGLLKRLNPLVKSLRKNIQLTPKELREINQLGIEIYGLHYAASFICQPNKLPNLITDRKNRQLTNKKLTSSLLKLSLLQKQVRKLPRDHKIHSTLLGNTLTHFLLMQEVELALRRFPKSLKMRSYLIRTIRSLTRKEKILNLFESLNPHKFKPIVREDKKTDRENLN